MKPAGNWNLSGLILEGISGSGKTALLQRLLRLPRFTERNFSSSLVLSEHQTQRILERKDREQGLVLADHLAVLNQPVAYLETVNQRLAQMQWCQANLTDMRMPYIFERFHFTHVVQYEHVNWADVAPIDARLARLNARVVVLVADASSLEQRIITQRSGPFRDYIRRFGSTNAQIIDHFLNQQAALTDLCQMTQLENLVIDTSTQSLDVSLHQVIEFWGAI